MKKLETAAAVGALAVGAGLALGYKRIIRMPLRVYTRYALYMAVLDDEICRNELEGVKVEGGKIRFPHKSISLQDRYQLFLQMNRGKSRRAIQQEIQALEIRLEQSKQGWEIGPDEDLKICWSEAEA